MSISWPTYYCPAKDICTATFGTIAALKMHAAKVGHDMDKSALRDAINNPKTPGGFLPGLSESEHVKTDHMNSEIPVDPLDANAPDSEFSASPFEAGPSSPDVPLQQLEGSTPPVVWKGVHPHGDQDQPSKNVDSSSSDSDSDDCGPIEFTERNDEDFVDTETEDQPVTARFHTNYVSLEVELLDQSCNVTSAIDGGTSDAHMEVDSDHGDVGTPWGHQDQHEPEDSAHRTADQDDTTRMPSGRIVHPLLNGLPCDADGEFLPAGAPPPPREEPHSTGDWYPWSNKTEFEMTDFLYRKAHMSRGNIKDLLDICSRLYPDGTNPAISFRNRKEILAIIDKIKVGDVPWERFSVKYKGETTDESPTWMRQSYTVHYRDPLEVAKAILANTDFLGSIDYAPYLDLDEKGERRYHDFMSGDWAWEEANEIIADERTHGAMLVPVILGSDKTTVSVATGDNEYYPLYMSLGNLRNGARRAHHGGVVLIGFLSIPKTEKQFEKDEGFRHFKKKIFHQSLAFILRRLRPAMTTPIVLLCADGYYRRVIFSLGPYLADYPEQVLVTGIVQGWCGTCPKPPYESECDTQCLYRSTERERLIRTRLDPQEAWNKHGINCNVTPFTDYFPRGDIYRALTPDILHQLVKGVFKDHFVTWTEKYIEMKYGRGGSTFVDGDINRRISVAPPFPKLRRFPQGRGFKQWTGDDSKGLMKVLLPAYIGYVPDDMIRAMRTVLDFVYIVRRPVFTQETLKEIEILTSELQEYRDVYRKEGVRSGFFIPKEHIIEHFPYFLALFGAPNAVCTSITESMHIRAVKDAYRRSNKNEEMAQMLLTNQRMDKLNAARIDFERRGMTSPSSSPHWKNNIKDHRAGSHDVIGRRSSCDSEMNNRHTGDSDKTSDPRRCHWYGIDSDVYLAKTPVSKCPDELYALSDYLGIPRLPELVYKFLLKQVHPDYTVHGARYWQQQIDEGGIRIGRISIYNSATVKYSIPSDYSLSEGIQSEIIRASSIQQAQSRHDCVLINGDPSITGFRGMHVARVRLLLSFNYEGRHYPCALVHWFTPLDDAPDELTGMWVVEPEWRDNTQSLSVIHADAIHRLAHLLPVFRERVPSQVTCHNSLDLYKAFYVNKYADLGSHELLHEPRRRS